jgi:hypothetical protein
LSRLVIKLDNRIEKYGKGGLLVQTMQVAQNLAALREVAKMFSSRRL